MAKDSTSQPAPPAASQAPWDRPQTSTRSRAQARRKENRARYMTISSSQPLQLEAGSIHNGAANSVSYYSVISGESVCSNTLLQAAATV